MSSVDVTQAVLVQFPTRDHSQASQRLALFDEVTGEPYPFSGEEWKDIPADELKNGWAYLPENPPPQYRKRPNGHVEARGVVAPGSKGTIWTYPEGYRHNYQGGALHFPVIGSTGVADFCIMPNGDLVALNYIGTAEQSGWFSLASIMFSIT